jgi:DUF1680 family protein
VSQRLQQTDQSDGAVLFFGSWEETTDAAGQACRRSNLPFSASVAAFRGPTIRWLGSKGPDHGLADVYVDGVLEGTVDAYAATPLGSQVLFEKTELNPDRTHTVRVSVRRQRNPAATNCFQTIAGFASDEPVDYPKSLSQVAAMELAEISAGTKPYLGPDQWKPVPYAATAPERGVVLQTGLMLDCFNRNIAYLNRCFDTPFLNTAGENGWIQGLPASAEGRMLGGAGHSLRWGERADLRAIVDTLVARVRGRQTANGYCLPYDEAFMSPQPSNWADERRNYDRVGLTRGMIAAGIAGNPDAYEIMRKFYDWYNQSPYYPQSLLGEFYGSGHNCNNGHEGGLLMYFSPVGKPEDLIAVERYFVQDFFIHEARNAEPLSLGFYPLHVPHSYVILAFQAWLDHYRATGAPKYLEAAQGAWRIVKDSYEHVGGTIAICEIGIGDYPPKSYYLAKHTGETCGSVFWADLNHRFLQFFPGEERYAAEIEKVIYNVILAAQDQDGSIRYHSHLHGAKEASQCANTCCEVMGVPFIARLPQYVYSIAADGVYVNLYEPSSIAWELAGQNVGLKLETGFPFGLDVALTVTLNRPQAMQVRVRVPGWATAPVPVLVNGEAIATGQPGTYVTLDRLWSDQDRITFTLPIGFRLTQYEGLDQVSGWDRYALEYGPVLLALVGPLDEQYKQPLGTAVEQGKPCSRLHLAPGDLFASLEPVDGQPLHFRVKDDSDHTYVPYWEVNDETFTCFPIIGAD